MHRKNEPTSQEDQKVDKLLDRPIYSKDADALGFSEASLSLIEAIEAQPNSSSLTLGLDGAWGSGKSSILEMMRGVLDERDQVDGIGLVVVPFSPWLITNRTALVASFFAQIGAAIDEAERRLPKNWYFFRKDAAKTLSKAKRQLNRFSGVVSVASTATSVFDPTMISAVAAGGTKAVEKLTSDSGKPGKTLETLKTELTEALGEIAKSDPTFRILVLIDDLDRLDPNDALEVLRLVKAVGDFPATTYLLAYDRSAIASAIEHSAKIDNGDAYLEKIIQFSFKVPPLEPFQLRHWLRQELQDLFPGEIDFASERSGAILDRWAGRLLLTPRDVKRLLFALRATWPKLRGKADILDLVWLQMIAQKASDKQHDLYSWIVGYLQALEALAIGGSVSGERETREELKKILTGLGWRTYHHDKDKMSFDFHDLDELLAGVTTSYLSSDQEDWTHKVSDEALHKFRDSKRLSSPWHWRLYFAFDAPSHAITDDEWDVLTNAAEESSDELSAAIAKVLDIRGEQRTDAADQIIGRAAHEVTSGKLDWADRWITAVVQQAGALEERSKKDRLFGFTKMFGISLKAFARAVFKGLEGEPRKTAISEIFDKPEYLCVAAELLRDQFHASKKSGYERDEKYYLTDEELKEVSANQVELYENLSPEDLRKLPSPYDVLYAWRDVVSSGDADGPSELLEAAFQTDAGLVETLEALRYVSSSAQDGVPHVPEGFLKNFVDPAKIKARLTKIAKGGSKEAKHAEELLGLWWEEK
jgi:energy-coupling factor transporter ATP-binding protein EcfA2